MRRWRAIALITIAAIAVSGCGRDPNAGLTPREVKERYARLLLDGVAHGMSVVTAESVDPATLELRNVRLEDGQHYLHADRAEILVSTELEAVSLRLYGVVTADPESGRLVAIEGFTTEPVEIASLAP
jgi:hypothetical protein